MLYHRPSTSASHTNTQLWLLQCVYCSQRDECPQVLNVGIKLIVEPVNGAFPEKQRHTSWDIQLHTLILTQLSVCADVCHRNGVFHWWMRYITPYMFHLNHNAISLHLRLTGQRRGSKEINLIAEPPITCDWLCLCLIAVI